MDKSVAAVRTASQDPVIYRPEYHCPFRIIFLESFPERAVVSLPRPCIGLSSRGPNRSGGCGSYGARDREAPPSSCLAACARRGPVADYRRGASFIEGIVASSRPTAYPEVFTFL